MDGRMDCRKKNLKGVENERYGHGHGNGYGHGNG